MIRGRRRHQRHLALLVEQLPQSFVWTTDTELRLTGLAGKALAILRVEDSAEVLGSELAVVLAPTEDGGAAILDAHRRALAGESSSLVVERRSWAFDVHVEPVREGDTIVGVGGIALDASKRLLAEHALAASEAQFRTLVERLPRLVTYVNPLGLPIRTTYVSPQVEAMFGYPAERWLTEDDFWVSRIHPDDRERVLEQTRRTHAGESPFSGEYRLVAADGRAVRVRDETVPVTDEQGNPLFLQGFMIEVGAHEDELGASDSLARSSL